MVQAGEIVVKGAELIECDLPRTRIKGCAQTAEGQQQLGALLRTVCAIRPAHGYIQALPQLYVCKLGAYICQDCVMLVVKPLI